MVKRIKSVFLWMLVLLSIGLSALLWVIPSPSMSDGESARYKTPISFGQTIDLNHLFIPEAIIVQHQDGSRAMMDPSYVSAFWDEQLFETLHTIIDQMQAIKEPLGMANKDVERYRLFFAQGITMADVFDHGPVKQEGWSGQLRSLELILRSDEQEKGLLVRIFFDDGHEEDGWISDADHAYWLKLVPPLSRWISVTSINAFPALHPAHDASPPPEPSPDTSTDARSTKEETLSENRKTHTPEADVYEADLYDAIPEKPLDLPVYVDRFVAISTDDAAEALFLDLSTMRQVKERDGGRIFSDGLRSLKIMGDHRMMRYFSPPLPKMRESSENQDALKSAVQFINRHAGWNGDERLVERTTAYSGETMVFRSAVDGYALAQEGDALAYYTIRVEFKGDDVIAYERTLWRRISRDGDGRRTLLSAEALIRALQEQVPNPQIQNVRIAYRAELTSTTGVIRLVPGYVVTLIDGKTLFFAGRASDDAT